MNGMRDMNDGDKAELRIAFDAGVEACRAWMDDHEEEISRESMVLELERLIFEVPLPSPEIDPETGMIVRMSRRANWLKPYIL